MYHLPAQRLVSVGGILISVFEPSMRATQLQMEVGRLCRGSSEFGLCLARLDPCQHDLLCQLRVVQVPAQLEIHP